MSGSPKYCEMRIAAQQRAEIERRQIEEQKFAEQRRKQRQAELAHQRLQAIQSEVTQLAEGCSATIMEMSQPGHGMLGTQRTLKLESLINSTQKIAKNASDEGTARKAFNEMELLYAEIRERSDRADRLNCEVNTFKSDLASIMNSMLSTTGYLKVFINAAITDEIRSSFESLQTQLTEITSTDELTSVRRQLRLLKTTYDRVVSQSSKLAQSAEKIHQAIESENRTWTTTCSGELSKFVTSEIRQSIQSLFDRVSESLERAINGETLQAVRVFLAELEETCRRETAAANSACRSAHLDAEAAALINAEEQLTCVDPTLSEKFDGNGFTKVKATFAKCKQLLDAGDLEKGREMLIKARTELETHRKVVSSLQTEWEENRNHANTALEEYSALIERTLCDPVLQPWLSGNPEVYHARIRTLHCDFEAERFEDVTESATLMSDEFQSSINEAITLAERNDNISELTTQLEELHKTSGQEFDVTGLRIVTSYLESASSNLKKRDLTKCDKVLAEASRAFESHRVAVEKEFSRWQIQRDETANDVLTARECLTAALEDESVSGWMADDLEKLEKVVARAEGHLKKGHLRDATLSVAGFEARVARVVTAAKPYQVQAAMQNYIVDGIVKVMKDNCFKIPDNPEEEEVDNPRSAIIIKAIKDEKPTITVAVEQTGHVEYEIGGAYQKLETSDTETGRPIRTCDEGELQILQFHKILGEMGIEADELRWDGKPDPPPDVIEIEPPIILNRTDNRTSSRKP